MQSAPHASALGCTAHNVDTGCNSNNMVVQQDALAFRRTSAPKQSFRICFPVSGMSSQRHATLSATSSTSAALHGMTTASQRLGGQLGEHIEGSAKRVLPF